VLFSKAIHHHLKKNLAGSNITLDGDFLVTCGVTYGNGTRRELEEAGADYIIDTIDKLIDIVR